MSAEKVDLGKLEKKVDKLVEEVVAIKKELKALSSLEGLMKEQGKQLASVSKVGDALSILKNIDDTTSSTFQFVGDKFASLSEVIVKSNNTENIIKKMDDVIGTIAGLDTGISELKSIDMNAGISELKASISQDTEVLVKKIDDLQQYIAGLSSLEENVEKLSSSFTETQEIVGIIVRQLDDIERKYKSTIEEINEAVAMMIKIADDIKSAPVQVTAEAPPMKPKKEPPIGQPLPDTIDRLIDYLLEMVTPQTEAAVMADTLERVRDRLTTLIKGHTPVLFQFGTLARELKSYPPTATLNENDIARLSKEIRGWRGRLEEMAKSD